MIFKYAHSAALAVLVSISAAGCYAAKIKIGDAAPDFGGIIGTDDQKHGLADFKDCKAVLVVFTCNQCPVARSYEDRLIALEKDYAPKGVQVIAINVNKDEGNALAAMKVRAKEKSFNFPYLFDSTQKSAIRYGAKCTPHAFVLDKDRKLVYAGAIDDNMSADKVETSYVRDALDAVLAGKTPAKAETRPIGCGIHYESAQAIDGPGLKSAVAKHRGQVVMVDFWATWCLPCIKLFPHSVELQRKLAGKGLHVITVSLDEPDQQLAVMQFLEKQSGPTENYLSQAGASQKSMEAFDLSSAIPCFKIYDRSGKLRETLGDVPETIDEVVNRLVGER